MAYYRNGEKRPTAIWECAALARIVRVECKEFRCSRVAHFDPHELWALFWRRGWDDEFKVARHRFWCRECSKVAGVRVKNARVMELDPLAGNVTHRLPLMANEREWKHFLNRHKA